MPLSHAAMLGRVHYMRTVVGADYHVPCRTAMRAASQVSSCHGRTCKFPQHILVFMCGWLGSAAHLCFLSNSRLICEGDRSRQHRVWAQASARGWQRTYDAISFSTEYSMIAVVAIAMASASISSDMSTVFTCALKAAMWSCCAPRESPEQRLSWLGWYGYHPPRITTPVLLWKPRQRMPVNHTRKSHP